MQRLFGLTALLTGSLAMAGPASTGDAPVISDMEMLATLPGRLVCRGQEGAAKALKARLASAEALSLAQGMGASRMALYDAIPASDLPLGDIDPLARRYFDQGLALAYGFNHRAAIRSFRHAQAIDPSCAMCWWGVAMASGPNINAGMSEAENAAALEAMAMAQRLAANAPPQAQELIAAQALRFSSDAGPDRAPLDQAYANAMIALARKYPDGDDLAVLAAESAMNTAPWNYWDLPSGEPRPLIGDAVDLIETVSTRSPAHPQASHLYIHLLELPEPERAEAAADRLRASGPATLGHLVHMPSHIYYRVGRYADSAAVNRDAVRADEAYLASVGDDGMVRYGYYPHNVHFLLTSAQMMGDVDTVLTQSARLSQIVDEETGRDLPWVQSIYAAPFFALAQYGSPASVLALTDDPHPLPFVDALRHYARAVGMARMKDGAGFDRELAALNAARASQGIADLEAMEFPAGAILDLAAEVARGRQRLVLGDAKGAIPHFERAVALEKAIPYNEPPFWYYPVSQSLGAALFMAGRHDDARGAFRQALFEAPNDALALYGLAQTEKALGHDREAAVARKAFSEIWMGPETGMDMTII
ncbi:hypothetical protein [Croceicoccus sp. Ery5]|uniref:tetratricopeptide repeat protein n=1 Tax=Croceicoccus sp. Ery5 TaxID=1703340 RepID=UPI001E57960C|nr:hypothetical protein [Croceicoccus sp. Ery5]